jgi:cysteine desulfuration protein SufE
MYCGENVIKAEIEILKAYSDSKTFSFDGKMLIVFNKDGILLIRVDKIRIMMTIESIQNEIIDEFSMFDDWMQKYEYMIDLGKSLPLISENNKLDDRLIAGCQSKVWLDAQLVDGKINYTADSDAIITKGIIAILLRVFSNQTPNDILNSNTNFIDEIGLKEHLSPTRANGLVSMIKQLKIYALAFQAQINK